jgi:ubiquinone/menaquinone biosynthesis C-methylase UbiE
MFNAVIVLDGLDHFLDPKKALQEIHRVSKKEAILALAVGNYLSLWPALEIFWDKFGKGRKYLETHLTRFTKKTLANMVNSNGFHNVKITTIHNSRPFFSILTKKYSKKIEIFLSEYSLGMTLLLTAKK